jgi:hypothetical protein
MTQTGAEQLFGDALAMVGTVRMWAEEASLEDLMIVETTMVELIAHRRWTVAGVLRARGYSWADIGSSLGISAQRAHLVYGPGSTARYGPAEVDPRKR